MIKLPLTINDWMVDGVIFKNSAEYRLPVEAVPELGDTIVDGERIYTILQIGKPVFNDCWRCKSVDLSAHYLLYDSIEIWRSSSSLNALGARVLTFALEGTVIGRVQPGVSGVVVERAGKLMSNQFTILTLEDVAFTEGMQARVGGVIYDIVSITLSERLAVPNTILAQIKV